MKNTKLIRFVESFIFFPVLTMSSMPVGPISQTVVNIVNTSPIVFSQKQNIGPVENGAVVALGQLAYNGMEAELQTKADAIDAYFRERDMPLEGQGMKMVLEAVKNDLDWRLLPAIAIRESTGGKNECKKVENNAFGWGSCKIGFSSNEEAIETVARNLGGNNPNTAHHYDDKTTKQILRAYNPPSVVPRYAEQVISIMNAIGDADEVVIPNTTT